MKFKGIGIISLIMIIVGLTISAMATKYYLPGINAMKEAERRYSSPLSNEYHRGENYENAWLKIKEAKEHFRKGEISFLFDYKLEEDIGTTLMENKLQLVELLLSSGPAEARQAEEALEKIIKEVDCSLGLSPFPSNKITIIKLREKIDELKIKQNLHEVSVLVDKHEWSEAEWELNKIDTILVCHFDLYDFHDKTEEGADNCDRFFYPSSYKRLWKEIKKNQQE